MSNKAWFFGAYQPALTTTKRTVDAASSGNTAAASISRTQKQQIQYLTAQRDDAVRIQAADTGRIQQQLIRRRPASCRRRTAPTTRARTTKRATERRTGRCQARRTTSVNQKLLLGFRGGDSSGETHTTSMCRTHVKFTFASTQRRHGRRAGEPAAWQRFTNVLSNNAITKDLQERKYAQADATLYVHGGGTHQIKGGVQFDLRSEDINSGNLKQVLTLNWGQSTTTRPGIRWAVRLATTR